MIEYIYGTFEDQQLEDNFTDLGKQIFNCLIKKEQNDENIEFFIQSLLYRMGGLNTLLGAPPELITAMSLLEQAKSESNFKMFRKSILDACGIMYHLSQKVSVNHEH